MIDAMLSEVVVPFLPNVFAALVITEGFDLVASLVFSQRLVVDKTVEGFRLLGEDVGDSVTGEDVGEGDPVAFTVVCDRKWSFEIADNDF